MTIPKPNLENLNTEYKLISHDFGPLRVKPTLDIDSDGTIFSAGMHLESQDKLGDHLEVSLREPNKSRLQTMTLQAWIDLAAEQGKLTQLILPQPVKDYLERSHLTGNHILVHDTYALISPRVGAEKLNKQLGDQPLQFSESNYTVEFIPSLEDDGSYLIVITNAIQITVKISEPGQKLIVAERIIKVGADDQVIGQKYSKKVIDVDDVVESLNRLSRIQAYWLKVQNLLDAKPGGSAGLES